MTTDHTVWATTGRGLFRLSGSRWQQAGASWGLPSTSFGTLLIDHRGALWTATINTLFRLRAGSKVFETILRTSAPPQVSARNGEAVDRDGRIWLTLSEQSKLISIDPDVPTRESPPDESAFPTRTMATPSALLADRDGMLWVATEKGLGRLREPATAAGPALDFFSTPDGLSITGIFAMLEDREGNVWVSTLDGLDRFSRRRVVPLPLAGKPDGRPFALAADPRRLRVDSGVLQR